MIPRHVGRYSIVKSFTCTVDFATLGMDDRREPRDRPEAMSKEEPSGTITEPLSPPRPLYAAPPSVNNNAAWTPDGRQSSYEPLERVHFLAFEEYLISTLG